MKQLNWYQIFGQTKVIPDGKTVEPTDDIQIWLNCADVWDKTYTTLAEVLADTDTLLTLVNSNNAVDYLVRSKLLCGIGLVPIMESNTTPSGVCIGSTFYGTGNEFFKAFDGNSSTLWASLMSDKTNAWIGYAFDTPVICNSFILNSYTGRTFATVYVEGSNDGITWTVLNGGSTINVTSAQDNPTKFIFTNNTAYLKYRLRTATQVSSSYNCNVRELQFCMESLCDNATAMTYIGLNNYCANTLLADSDWCTAICNSTYLESVLNVKAPKMTSNTTPSGVCSGSSKYTGRDFYQAFDGSNSTYWYATDNDIPAYIQYQFTSAVKVKYVVFNVSGGNDPSQARVKDYDIKADGTVVYSSTHQTTSITEKAYLYNNETSATSWQVYIKNMWGGARIGLNQLQFYGREDV